MEFLHACELKDKLRVGKELSQTRNQGLFGVCYSFAGADLVEDYLKRHHKIKKSDIVSPISLMLQNKENLKIISQNNKLLKSLKEEMENINSLVETIESESESEEDCTLKQEACLREDQINNEVNLILKKMNFSLANLLEGGYTGEVISKSEVICLEDEVQPYTEKKVHDLKMAFKNILELNPEPSEENICHAFDSSQYLFKNFGLKSEDELKTLIKLADEEKSTYLNMLLKKNCLKAKLLPGELKVMNISLLGSTINGKKALVKNILKSGKPLSFAHCSSIYDGVSGFDECEKKCTGEDCDDYHSALITGMIKDCHNNSFYRVRNSWGDTYCKDYDTDGIHCDKNGDYIIPESLILKSTKDMTFMQE